MVRSLIICSLVLLSSAASAMQSGEQVTRKPLRDIPFSYKCEKAAEAFQKPDFRFTYENPFAQDEPMASAYQELMNYGCHLLEVRKFRASRYARSQLVDRQKSCWRVGASAALLGTFGGALRLLRPIKNNHLYAAGVVASTLATGVASLLIKPDAVFYFSPAEKVRRRALLDGYDTVRNLEYLSAEQIARLEEVFKQRINAKQYDQKDYVLPVIDEFVCELLACAKNKQGCVAMPVDVAQQKQDEAALRVAEVHGILRAIDAYVGLVNRFRSDVGWSLQKYLVPFSLAASYAGTHVLTHTLPHGCLRTGLVLGTTFIAGLASSKLGAAIYNRCLSFDWFKHRMENDKIQERRAAAESAIRGMSLMPDCRQAVEASYSFGAKYGYVPGCRGDWEEMRAGQCKPECELALALIRDVTQS